MNLNENKEGKLELSYLWLGDNCLSNIKNQEFNFSTDLEFKFVENKFSIKYKNKFINNFYGKNIINVSAIVGENGSGKTSIINFLKNSYYETGKVGNDEKDKSTIRKEIVIFKKSDKLHIFYTIDFEKHKVNNASNYQIIFHNLMEENFVDEFNKLERRATIFYSDAFNSMDESAHILGDNIQYNIQYNISTNHLVHVEKNNKLATEMQVDQVEKYKILDIFFQLNFLVNNIDILQKNEIINPSIKYVKIVMTNARRNNINRNSKNDVIIKRCGELNKLINKLENLLMKLSNNDIKNKCDNYFKISIMLELFYELFNILYTKDLIDKFNNSKCLNKNLIKEIDSENYFDIMKNIFKEIDKNKIIEGYTFGEFIDILNIFNGKWNNTNNYRRLILDLESNKEILKKFLSTYFKFNISGLFKVEWLQNSDEEDKRRLSSGEEAMLKMYARFYSLINYIDIGDGFLENKLDKKDINLLIILDEPELYLHPEWQRKLLSRLVEFFEIIFKDKNIQIILTSNTPFVISDIPKDNIIFIKKNEESKLCEVMSKDNIEVETFGANIHTLLTNSFFMENTIGEFANQKIKTVAKDLSEDTASISEDRKKEIKYIIDTIGEPIIKRKLKDMYNKKIEHFEINNRIEELSNKVKELEKIIKENSLV